ncbi:MAG: type II toxin-antitoxin system VapC family toxin [Ilumatobacteraceae bacterium]
MSCTAVRGLLDASTHVLPGRLDDATTLPDEPLISVVTLAELSVGPLVASSDDERAARQAHLQQAEADFDPLVFDAAAAARKFGQVAASLRRAGRKRTARSFDAMIAATAMVHDLPVHTCNPDDFAGIDDLTVVAVPHPVG